MIGDRYPTLVLYDAKAMMYMKIIMKEQAVRR
jgi:hypothetical protein